MDNTSLIFNMLSVRNQTRLTKVTTAAAKIIGLQWLLYSCVCLYFCHTCAMLWKRIPPLGTIKLKSSQFLPSYNSKAKRAKGVAILHWCIFQHLNISQHDENTSDDRNNQFSVCFMSDLKSRWRRG